MKRKLFLLFMPVLFSGAMAQAQMKVWDFGAEVLSGYDNKLAVADINGLYPGVAAGTTGKNIIDFTINGLNYTTANQASDRIRSTNAELIVWDNNVSPGATAFTGRLYVNSAGKSDRYLSIALTAGDQITIVAKADSEGLLTVENMADANDKATKTLKVDIAYYHFTAAATGTYKIYDAVHKPSYYRIYGGNVPDPSLATNKFQAESLVKVSTNGRQITVDNVISNTQIDVYSITGALVKSVNTNTNTRFDLPTAGFYIVKAKSVEGVKTTKIAIQ